MVSHFVILTSEYAPDRISLAYAVSLALMLKTILYHNPKSHSILLYTIFCMPLGVLGMCLIVFFYA